MSDTVLSVRGLEVEYATARGPARAVDGVSFELETGEFLAIVGESGCGKTTLLFAIARLLTSPAAIVGGSVIFNGVDLIDVDLGVISQKVNAGHAAGAGNL